MMAPVANDRVWEDVKAASQAKQNIHAKIETILQWGLAVDDKHIEQIAVRVAALATEQVLAELKAVGIRPVTTWLNLKAAAKHLAVSESYLSTQCSKGTGPHSIKRGRHRRFKEAWLDAWLIEPTENTHA